MTCFSAAFIAGFTNRTSRTTRSKAAGSNGGTSPLSGPSSLEESSEPEDDEDDSPFLAAFFSFFRFFFSRFFSFFLLFFSFFRSFFSRFLRFFSSFSRFRLLPAPSPAPNGGPSIRSPIPEKKTFHRDTPPDALLGPPRKHKIVLCTINCWALECSDDGLNSPAENVVKIHVRREACKEYRGRNS